MTDIELRWYYANDWQAPVLQYRSLPDTAWHEVPSASCMKDVAETKEKAMTTSNDRKWQSCPDCGYTDPSGTDESCPECGGPLGDGDVDDQ